MIRILIFLICIVTHGQTIKSSFELPYNYERVINDSYHDWIINQNIILDEPVYYYNGYIKAGLNRIYAAKFNYEIGTLDLHQCADATIYLHAKYHWDRNQLSKIKYHFTNGMLYSYEDFLKGIRPVVKGNESKLVRSIPPEMFYENTLLNLRKYLRIIWSYAGTLSLEYYDTESVGWDGPYPGDMFLRGGSPGHVVNVVDIVSNGRDRKYILSQSWMPAQEHEILLNPKDNSVWFSDKDILRYLRFDQHDLKRFKK